jgi:ADP-ribose pyrophosphatase YjhB (NUDIX family)
LFWEAELHCSDCGARLVERQIEGRLRAICPVCGRVSYCQLKVGAGVLVQQDGMLLLVQRGPDGAFPGTWNLPAGYCEADESPQVTAAREAAEETGLRVKVGGLVDVYFFDDDPRGNGLLIVYEAEIVGGSVRTDGSAAMAVGFFPPDRLPEPLCGGGHDRAIGAWQGSALDRWQPGAPLRYCPHCAHCLEVRLAFDRLRPTCPACGFVHFREPKVGVSVLVEQGGSVLLVQRAVDPGLGKWGLPSGFVEWDEAPEDAARRECAEETGLRVALLGLPDVVHYTDDFRGPGINLTYHARVSGGVLRPGDDASAVRFFSPTELPPAEGIAFTGHVRALEQWRAVLQSSGLAW